MPKTRSNIITALCWKHIAYGKNIDKYHKHHVIQLTGTDSPAIKCILDINLRVV